MSFYRPTYITEWIRKEVKNTEQRGGYVSKGTINRLERLKGAFEIIVSQEDEAFREWLDDLLSRDRILLPYIYDQANSIYQKNALLQNIQALAQSHRRIFSTVLDQCYRKNEFKIYWPIIMEAYKKNYEAITSRWSEQKKIFWDNLIESEESFLSFVASSYQRNEVNLECLLDKLQLKRSHLVFDLLMIEVFKSATKQFYLENEQSFTRYFKEVNNRTRQLIVSGYIKSTAYLELTDLNNLIIHKIDTYKSQPMLWSKVSYSIKHAFHSWKTRQDVIEFFEGLNKDHERFIYWEKFIPKMEDALVVEDNTILFYFSDVVIMEVLGTGAVYVYKLSEFNNRFGELIKKYKNRLEYKKKTGLDTRNYSLKRSQLMDKDMVYREGWLSHSGGWQYKFDRYLRFNLNWEVNRDAIIQAGKE